MSLGDAKNEKMTAAYRKAIQAMQNNGGAGLRWQADFTPGAHHGNNDAISLPVGLRKYYRD